ncbi:hypothetical protein GCM10018789_08760 [Streptomyces werraensis]|nr:hypothetical protein GCM10018789_08760 [Streptomyces werraensis]
MPGPWSGVRTGGDARTARKEFSVSHEDVDAAVAAMLRVLGPPTADAWTVPAGTLGWTCWQTAAHIGHDLPAYAGQLAARARPTDAYLLPVDLTVRPSRFAGRGALQSVTACGGLLSSAPATAGPDARAWHRGRAIPRASPRWASPRPSRTPTTSRRACRWTGCRPPN